MPEPATYTPTLVGGMFAAKRWHALPELVWPDDSMPRRACTTCRAPTMWKRPRKNGAATHPTCEATVRGSGQSPYDTVTHELYLDVLYAIAAQLGATVHTEAKPVEATSMNRRLGNPQAGCELCGRSHAALWIAARTWRCAQHPPSNDTYRRGRYA